MRERPHPLYTVSDVLTTSEPLSPTAQISPRAAKWSCTPKRPFVHMRSPTLAAPLDSRSSDRLFRLPSDLPSKSTQRASSWIFSSASYPAEVTHQFDPGATRQSIFYPRIWRSEFTARFYQRILPFGSYPRKLLRSNKTTLSSLSKIQASKTKVRDTHKVIDACSIGLISSFSLATRLSRSSSYSHLSTSPLSSWAPLMLPHWPTPSLVHGIVECSGVGSLGLFTQISLPYWGVV